MNLLAFAASNSSRSINKQLVTYAASLIPEASTEILDLNDYEMPLFSVDREAQHGHPDQAHQFLAKIAAADALLVSFAEHNNSYTAAWKNLYDWCSRIETRVYQDKPIVLLSTSPGGRGGANVMAAAEVHVPRFGGKVKATLSIPDFQDNFDSQRGELTHPELKTQLAEAVHALLD
ncbi:MAG: NAD(P)H-dependent oxidoreductase [Pseudohongiellaceae bacterium]|jgi:NAD(P)H-dependent FMN reductase